MIFVYFLIAWVGIRITMLGQKIAGVGIAIAEWGQNKCVDYLGIDMKELEECARLEVMRHE